MNKHAFKPLILILLILMLAIGATSCSFSKINEWVQSKKSAIDQHQISVPISRYDERVNKKPFGIKVSPADSPVQPERFYGYHTAVDFETFKDEQDIDVDIFAICKGPLILKRFASGYGGVIVQACKINDEDVTVIYGHLKLDSIKAKINDVLSMGEKIGVLGDAYTKETDGERKHLHLGIHKGKDINILGYVQNEKKLDEWIDILNILY